jgi:hypothetical protein
MNLFGASQDLDGTQCSFSWSQVDLTKLFHIVSVIINCLLLHVIHTSTLFQLVVYYVIFRLTPKLCDNCKNFPFPIVDLPVSSINIPAFQTHTLFYCLYPKRMILWTELSC